MSDMFMKASKLKLRFSTNKGDLTVEDLWDLPLISKGTALNLDNIAIALDQEVKANNGTTSFVRPVEKKGVDVAQLKFDIVKFIIDAKVESRDAHNKRQARNEERQKLLGLINQKENEATAALPVEELRAKLAAFAEDEDGDE